MDIGFIAVYNKLTQYLSNTYCYYKESTFKAELNKYSAKLISVTSTPEGDVANIKIFGNTDILNGLKIDLNSYIATINETYDSIRIINHTNDGTNDFIDCLNVPTIILDGTEEIEEIAFELTSTTKFTYGKFDMSWRPRTKCLFEGLQIDIEISVKYDEDRNIVDENTHRLLGLLLQSTSFKIDDNGNIGYFKLIGRPSVRKGVESGNNLQSTIISINGFYQINYN